MVKPEGMIFCDQSDELISAEISTVYMYISLYPNPNILHTYIYIYIHTIDGYLVYKNIETYSI